MRSRKRKPFYRLTNLESVLFPPSVLEVLQEKRRQAAEEWDLEKKANKEKHKSAGKD